MQGVIMAGGQGTRLRPLTLTDPKPFLPVGGRPVIEWGILSLKRAGIEDIIITTAYKKAVVQRHLGDGAALGVRLTYAEEATPLGTAGGVRNAADLIEDSFVVMSADVVSDVDLGALVRSHQAANASASIGLTRVADVSQFGIVVTDDENRVTRFQEKPTPEEAFSDRINAGIYVCEHAVLDRIPEDTVFDFSRDLWPKMLGKGLHAFDIAGYWKDVGRPQDLIEANIEQCRRLNQWVFGDAQVASDATLDEAVIMPGAQVGAEAQVTRSLVMPRALVGMRATLVDSVLAHDVRVGPGARLHRVVVGAFEEVEPQAELEDERIPPSA